MPSCSEPSCRNRDNSNMISCSSPFCSKQFHLTCVGLKGKAKEDITSLYFVCLSCNEFITYSNCKIDTKLCQIESELNKSIQSIKANIASLEQSINAINKRVDALENLNEQSKLETQNNDAKIGFTNKNVEQLEINLNDKISDLEKKIIEIQNNLIKEPPPPKVEKPTSVQNTFNVKYQIRVSGINEAPASLKYIEKEEFEKGKICEILQHLNETNVSFTDCFRVGKLKAESTKPRTVIVTLSNIWDKRKILSKANLLSNYKEKIFISPALTPSEINTEKLILKRRWELIQDGVERRDIKIKNLKLIVKGEEVAIKND